MAEDLALYDRLAAQGHWSPFEHQATPDEEHSEGADDRRGWRNPYEHGNFVGWRQHRKMLPGEAVAPLPEGFR